MGLEMLPPPVVDSAYREERTIHTDHTEADVRLLTQEELTQIVPVFEQYKATLPDPATSCFVGAIEDGKVIGFLCLQLKLHAEPMWIEDGASAVFPRIVQVAEQTIKDRVGTAEVFLFAPAGRISRLAQLQGMQIEPWVVMSKRVEGVRAVVEMPRAVEPESEPDPEPEPVERVPMEEMMDGAD